MYKVVALDVDGTLLNSDHVISKETLTAIKYAQSKECFVTISTGRPVGCINDFIEELKIKGPVITYNGACVVDSVTKTVMYEQCLDARTALELVDFALENDISFIFWSNDTLYTNSINDDVRYYSNIINVNAKETSDYLALATKGITKLLLISRNNRIDDLKRAIPHNIRKSTNYFTSHPQFIEFVDRNVSKGIALSKVTELLDVDQEHVVAMGDGENDIEMIKFASLGVAMENASDHVKTYASFVTKSNNNNGVAFAINKFI